MAMVDTTSPSAFQTANPHALAVILDASETRSIMASEDIFDLKGMKLWARNQPVTADLQRKLMDRALQRPLETCLMVEDGVTVQTLKERLAQRVRQHPTLAPVLSPHEDRLLKAMGQVRLHSVVQLLLSACESARPATFEHSVDAMALAGALQAAAGGDDTAVARAMTAGLLHDIGEMYLAPTHGEGDAANSLDIDTYRQMVVHPHIGQLLLSQLTDYPKELVRAVAEHHEKLDASGYPHRLNAEAMSPLGRLLAVTEETLAALRQVGANLAQASVALRVVPAEFDERHAGTVVAAARRASQLVPHLSDQELHNRLDNLDSNLAIALERLEGLIEDTPSPASLRHAVVLGHHLVKRLRDGWNASGLWSTDGIEGEDAAEAETVCVALQGRLEAIERSVRLTAGQGLSDDEQETLDQLCAIIIDHAPTGLAV
jgi:hypothetical protein